MLSAQISAPQGLLDKVWFAAFAVALCAFAIIHLTYYSFKTCRIVLPPLKPLFLLFFAYWIVGLLFTFIYRLIHFNNPDSFKGISTGSNFEFMYFSFVTITTLGYGDICPATFWPRVLALWEAAIGILFVGVLISIAASHRESIKHVGQPKVIKSFTSRSNPDAGQCGASCPRHCPLPSTLRSGSRGGPLARGRLSLPIRPIRRRVQRFPPT